MIVGSSFVKSLTIGVSQKAKPPFEITTSIFEEAFHKLSIGQKSEHINE